VSSSNVTALSAPVTTGTSFTGRTVTAKEPSAQDPEGSVARSRSVSEPDQFAGAQRSIVPSGFTREDRTTAPRTVRFSASPSTSTKWRVAFPPKTFVPTVSSLKETAGSGIARVGGSFTERTTTRNAASAKPPDGSVARRRSISEPCQFATAHRSTVSFPFTRERTFVASRTVNVIGSPSRSEKKAVAGAPSAFRATVSSSNVTDGIAATLAGGL